MATTSGITSSSTTSSTTNNTNAYSSLSSDDFLKIILTELSKQDPLKPNDTSATLQQLSTLRSIQSDTDLQDKLGSLTAQNELATAGGLIGKQVSGLNESSERATGVVRGVLRTSNGSVLVLEDGQRIPFKNFDQLVNAPKDDGPTTPPKPKPKPTPSDKTDIPQGPTTSEPVVPNSSGTTTKAEVPVPKTIPTDN